MRMREAKAPDVEARGMRPTDTRSERAGADARGRSEHTVAQALGTRGAGAEARGMRRVAMGAEHGRR